MNSRIKLCASAALMSLGGVLVAPAASAAPTTGTQQSTSVLSPSSRAELAQLIHPGTKADLLRLLDRASLPPAMDARLRAAVATLPANFATPARTPGSLGSLVENTLAGVLDPADYECASTPLNDYVASLLPPGDDAHIGELLVIAVLEFVGAFDIQPNEGLMFAEARPNVFGEGDAYRKTLTKAFGDAKGFWDIDSRGMILGAMDAALWQHIDDDPATTADDAARYRATAAYLVHFGLPETPENISSFMPLLKLYDDLMATYAPSLQDGRSPLFTFNAFAFHAAPNDLPALAGLSDRIIYGDGLLKGLEAVGLQDVGPQVVLGHEYGHQVQYQRNVFHTVPAEDQPEETRRTELMADGLGGYFATHKRGLTLNAKRVKDAVSTIANVGDCGFTDPGHHGTPNQRTRAVQWGISEAADAQKQGQVQPSASLITKFDQVLPTLVAPDAR